MIRIRKRNGVWQVRQRYSEENNDPTPAEAFNREVCADVKMDRDAIREHIERIMNKGMKTWWDCENEVELHNIIASCASMLHYYVLMVMDVINGTSDIYYLEDGVLITKQKYSGYFCATGSLQRRENVETILKHMDSGVWVVKKWVTTLSYKKQEGVNPDTEPLRKEYFILVTSDERFIPFEQIQG